MSYFLRYVLLSFLFSATVAQWVGGGRLIESLTGLSYTTALFLFTFSVLVYVLIGGFRAVALSDTLLGIIMLVGTTIILIATVVAGGGIEKIMQELVQINPNLITPFGADGSLTKSYVTSFWILIGIGVVGLPQISVRAMSYKNSKAMHQALIIGTIVVGTIMIGMHLTGVFARVVLPGITVPDKVMPLLAMEVLPPWLAGVFLAAPMAAIMSTVNSLLLLVSSSIIKDIYVNYINKDAADSTIRKGSLWITAIVGLLVYAAAIKPPDFLIWLNLFSFGGLEAAFIWPIVLGLYWRKGNATGALASIVVGVGSYMCIHLFLPKSVRYTYGCLPDLLSVYRLHHWKYECCEKKQHRLYEKRSPYRTAFFSYEFVLFLFCISMTIHKLITIEGMELRSMKKSVIFGRPELMTL